MPQHRTKRAQREAAAPQPPLVLQEFLPYRLSALAEVVSGVFAKRYDERFGLSIAEWRVMAVVGEGPPQSTQQVIDRTGMDRVRVSRAVIRLADKGLLQRHPQPGDRRAQMLSLSPGGSEIYGRIVPLARDMQKHLASALDDEERRQLDITLGKLMQRAREMMRQLD